MERLYVKCSNCKEDFISPMQFDKVSFESATLSGNKSNCPHCGNMVSCDKENMHFK